MATCCHSAGAYAGSDLGIVVPRDNATCGPADIAHDPQCHYDYVCYRFDSLAYMVDPGQQTQQGGSTFTCDTCALCCTDIKTYCIGQVCVSVSRTFIFSIAPQITVGIQAITAGLGAAFSAQSQTTATFCASVGNTEFPACRHCTWRALITVYQGQSWAMTHSYSWYTRLTNGPPEICGPVGAESLDNTCSSTQTSTLTSDAWGAMWAEGVGCDPCR